MNAQLVEYGIQNEQSDIRAHVCPLAKRVLVYRTYLMRTLLRYRQYPVFSVSQPGVNGIITGQGRKVPIADCPWIRELPCADYKHWDAFGNFQNEKSTSEKGRQAVQLVCFLLGNGRFPLWLKAADSTDVNIQLSGTDILLVAKW